MYRKNVAGQFITFQLISTTDGSAITGVSPAVRRCIDGTFAAGGGTVTEDTGGYYKYAMSQADTNGNNIGFRFSGTGAITVALNIVTTAADPTDTVRFGLTALPNVASGNAGALLVDGTGTAAISNSSGKVLLQATQSGVTIPTVTTVTNQLTAAQIATGVWTDTTAGDFTTALSVGKSVMNGVSLGTGLTIASVSGAVGSVTGAVGSVTGLTAATVHSDLDDIQSRLPAALTADGNIKADTLRIGGTVQTAGDVGAKTGFALTSAYDFAKGTTAMTESYAANGAAPTPVQAIMAMHQMLMDFGISGTSYTVKKLDNSTTAFVVTLNDATSPTAAART
jgi:hypothetical protein